MNEIPAHVVADCLVYLGVITDPEEADDVKLIHIEGGVITVERVAFYQINDELGWTTPGEDESPELSLDDEGEPEPDEPGMTLEEAQMEVTRRSRLRPM